MLQNYILEGIGIELLYNNLFFFFCGGKSIFHVPKVYIQYAD